MMIIKINITLVQSLCKKYKECENAHTQLKATETMNRR
jgi:hypothetical protein